MPLILKVFLSFTKKNLRSFKNWFKKRHYKKGGNDETIFLEPLSVILDSGKSPAETWKNLFLGEWNNNVDMLYKTNYFKILKKNEKKFNTIEEIRNEIDKLDLKIIELISQRKDLVFEVVKLKKKIR